MKVRRWSCYWSQDHMLKFDIYADFCQNSSHKDWINHATDCVWISIIFWQIHKILFVLIENWMQYLKIICMYISWSTNWSTWKHATITFWINLLKQFKQEKSTTWLQRVMSILLPPPQLPPLKYETLQLLMKVLGPIKSQAFDLIKYF